MADYSFIANTGQQQPQQQFNPLAQVGQYAQLQEAINRNQEFRANKLAGALYQQAVDPATGQLDPNKLVTLGSQEPGAALAMPEMVRAAQARRGEQLQQARDTNTYMNQNLMPLLAKDNVSSADVVQMLTAANKAGWMPKQAYDAAMNELSSVPPDQIRPWIVQHAIAGMDTGNKINFMYGQHMAVNRGATTDIVQVPGSGAPARTVGSYSNSPHPENLDTGPNYQPTSGGVPVAPPIPKSQPPAMPDVGPGYQPTIGGRPSGPMIPKDVSPEVATIPIEIENPQTGEHKIIQRFQLNQYNGWRPLGAPATGSAPAGGTASPPAAAPGRAAANTPPAEPRGLPTGMPTGGPEVLRASSANFAQAQTYAGAYQDRVQPLERSLEALQTAKTGLGSQALHDLFSRVQTVAPDFVNRVINPQSPGEIAAYDELRKYLTQTAMNRPGAGRSDLGTQTAEQSSPNVNISQQAAQMLIKAQLSFERMKQAQYLDFTATHPNAATRGQAFNDYMANQSYRLDPRAFIADRQTPAERTAVLNSMKKGSAAYNNYMESYALAKKYQLGGIGG